MTKLIPLNQGLYALVDDVDFDRLRSLTWYATKGGRGNGIYAITRRYSLGTKAQVRMHRLILNAPRDLEVDHVNGDTLDNRRENLRLATRHENQRNCGKNKRNRSGYKGVIWVPSDRSWRAKIGLQGVVYYLGQYRTPEAAARAYDSAALRLHGDYARLNFAEVRPGVKCVELELEGIE